MKKGEVIFSPRHIFPDSSISKKLIINLNDPAPGEPYLLLLTTSQQKYRKNIPGCHSSSGYHVIPKSVDFFIEPFTWVLFNTLREYSLKEELRECWNNNFKTMCRLKDTTIRAIINCLKQSNFITKYQASLLR